MCSSPRNVSVEVNYTNAVDDSVNSTPIPPIHVYHAIDVEAYMRVIYWAMILTCVMVAFGITSRCSHEIGDDDDDDGDGFCSDNASRACADPKLGEYYKLV